MSGLSVALRAVLFLARHPATKAAFHGALRAAATELLRHATHHMRTRGIIR